MRKKKKIGKLELTKIYLPDFRSDFVPGYDNTRP